MNDFASIYSAIWSVLATIGGISLLIFREKFIKGIEHGFKEWYAKTGFFLFRLQSEDADSTYMRMVTVLVASMFIIVGIITLLKIF